MEGSVTKSTIFKRRAIYTLLWGIYFLVASFLIQGLLNHFHINQTSFTLGWCIWQFISGMLLAIFLQVCYPKRINFRSPNEQN